MQRYTVSEWQSHNLYSDSSDSKALFTTMRFCNQIQSFCLWNISEINSLLSIPASTNLSSDLKAVSCMVTLSPASPFSNYPLMPSQSYFLKVVSGSQTFSGSSFLKSIGSSRPSYQLLSCCPIFSCSCIGGEIYFIHPSLSSCYSKRRGNKRKAHTFSQYRYDVTWESS